jgi:hypothetical protein
VGIAAGVGEEQEAKKTIRVERKMRVAMGLNMDRF